MYYMKLRYETTVFAFFTAERLTGIKIQVCEDSKCQLCGYTTATPESAWATVDCANGPLKGNTVTLDGTNSGLNFCEIKIQGKSKIIFIL